MKSFDIDLNFIFKKALPLAFFYLMLFFILFFVFSYKKIPIRIEIKRGNEARAQVYLKGDFLGEYNFHKKSDYNFDEVQLYLLRRGRRFRISSLKVLSNGLVLTKVHERYLSAKKDGGDFIIRSLKPKMSFTIESISFAKDYWLFRAFLIFILPFVFFSLTYFISKKTFFRRMKIIVLHFLKRISNFKFFLFLASFAPSFKAEYVFISLSVFFGLAMLLITPAFQAPDEYQHFTRAYLVSELRFNTEYNHEGKGGIDVPKSVDKINFINTNLPFHPKHKVIKGHLKKYFNMPLNAEDRVFIPRPITHQPILHAIPAIAMFFGRLLNLPPIVLSYMGRLANLLFYALIVFWAVRIMPFYKWSLTLIALFPMSLFMASSISYDSYTLCFSFLFFASIINLRYKEGFISSKDLLPLVISAALFPLAKIFYYPLLSLFLIIPIKKFSSKKKYFAIFSMLLILPLLLILIQRPLYTNSKAKEKVSLEVRKDKTEKMQEDVVKIKTSKEKKKDKLLYIIKNPISYTRIIIKTTRVFLPKFYKETMLGTFGWLDTRLPLDIYSMLVWIIILTAFAEGAGKNLSFTHLNRLLLIMNVIGVYVLIHTALFLWWTKNALSVVTGVQGRYLILLLFPFMLSFQNNCEIKIINKGFNLIITLIIIVSLSVSVKTLLSRYYGI